MFYQNGALYFAIPGTDYGLSAGFFFTALAVIAVVCIAAFVATQSSAYTVTWISRCNCDACRRKRGEIVEPLPPPKPISDSPEEIRRAAEVLKAQGEYEMAEAELIYTREAIKQNRG